MNTVSNEEQGRILSGYLNIKDDTFLSSEIGKDFKALLNTVAAKMPRWVAGKAADLVIFHGVELAKIEKVLADLVAMREAGTLRSAGAFFHSKAKAIDAAEGVGLFANKAD